MKSCSARNWAALCCLALAGPALAGTVTLEYTGKAPYELGSKVWFVTKLDGRSQMMTMYVNGIKGGNSTVGTINNQNGEFKAPTLMPEGQSVTVTAETMDTARDSASVTLALKLPRPTIAAITPALLTCGQPYTLTITGTRYAADSVVWINQKPAPTTFVSATQLSATGFASQPDSTVSLKVATTINGISPENYSVHIGSCTAPAPAPSPDPTTTTEPAPTPTPTPTPTPVPPAPLPDAEQVAAVRFLEQATFGAAPADVARLKSIGASAWLAEQFAMTPSAMPITTDMNALRNNWYLNMANGKDQLRQRMIFALSQIFVISSDKNPYANELQPWLLTIDKHAFGNFDALLREMTLNPAMGKYLDLGNSRTPSPNENYAREVMQLFTVGPNLLNQDGSFQRDINGELMPTYDQARIGDFARALSGWTYPGPSATGINWENFTGPLQPRDNYHDMSAKTLLGGISVPAGQSTLQDFEAVMQNLFNHPNVAPFIATRLIRAFTTSNPSPAYITRVADVFASGGRGRGDLAATLQAVLLDPEALAQVNGAPQGHLKDPIMHTISLMRTMGATVVDPTNLFWEYTLLGQKLIGSPSVFNFYSPMTRLPGSPQYFGPEFQIYAPSLAIGRANMIYRFLSGEYGGMVKFDITPYVTAAATPSVLLDMVSTNLTAGRMSASTRNAIGTAVQACTDNKQRAITALYLTAISAEFAVSK